jgi:very-short-patch-repair endonuclease
MPAKKTTAQFIEDAVKVHGDKYDYSLVEYVNDREKVKIICYEHGMFYQLPYSHVGQKSGCLQCGFVKSADKSRHGLPLFIQMAKEKHGDRYDYSLVEYKQNLTPVKIICTIHGEFEQTPKEHKKGSGCPTCGLELRAASKVLRSANLFIEKARSVHGGKYDYKLVDYKKAIRKVKIICKEHGIFKQSPNSHLGGNGCPTCAHLIGTSKRSLTLSDFLEKAKTIHSDLYDYSLVDNYKNYRTILNIICKEHGVFKQKASNHLTGNGCQKCGRAVVEESKRLSQSDFLERSTNVHASRYDYSLVMYKNNSTKVKIICKEHGIFKQTPNNHMSGAGCKKCAIDEAAKKRRKNNAFFIKKATLVHGNSYDYSLVKCDGTRNSVMIICKTHGVFTQNVSGHLNGRGCPKCGYENTRKSQLMSTEDFVKKAKKRYGNKYDYSLTQYTGYYKDISIICREHGLFRRKAGYHLIGDSACPKCNSSKGELRIEKYLKTTCLLFESQKRFDNCRNKKRLPFDFYIPAHNLLIEYDGEQHFIPVKMWGGEGGLERNQKRDAIKTRYAERHNIRLVRIPYTEYDRIEEILSEALKLEYQPLQLSLFAA